jgi:hypothetical protein
MFSRFSYSLSFRLLVIFLVLGGLFVFGTMKAIQRFYNSDDIRGLISGHLSLHVHYVREDIGVPPNIERALAITRSVPVDIRISGPDVDWASDPAFPLMSALDFAPSPKFSDEPDAWVDELQGVEFAALDGHNFLKMKQGGYDIVVSTPRIADEGDRFGIVPQILGLGLTFLLCAYFAVRWLFRPIVSIREGAALVAELAAERSTKDGASSSADAIVRRAQAQASQIVASAEEETQRWFAAARRRIEMAEIHARASSD